MPEIPSRRTSGLKPWQFALPPERLLFYYKLVFVVFVLCVPVIHGTSSAVFQDGDVSWHVATGQWILANGRIPSTDPFSFTMAGQPWVPHEWLADVILGAAYGAGGFAGLAAIVVLALFALHLVVFVHLQGQVGPVAVFLTLLSVNIILAPFVLARPHVLVWPVLALWTVLLLRAAESERGPPVWLPLLMLLWANLHGSFLLGFAVYGFLALEALMSAGWPRRLFTGWLVVGLACGAAALLNGNGFSGLWHPLFITNMEILPLIEEWQPTTLQKTPAFFAVLAVTIFVIVRARPQLPRARAMLLVLLLIMALSQVRHQTWLTIVAALALVPYLGRQAQSAGMFWGPAERKAWIAMTAGAVAGFVVIRLAIPFVPTEHDGNPASLIAAVPDELRDQPVLNGYSFGGPLILNGIRPYIDGRADMYGDDFVKDWRRIVDGDLNRFEAARKRYGLRWTILPPGTELVRHLDRSPRWHRIYADDIGIIHVLGPQPGSRRVRTQR